MIKLDVFGGIDERGEKKDKGHFVLEVKEEGLQAEFTVESITRSDEASIDIQIMRGEEVVLKQWSGNLRVAGLSESQAVLVFILIHAIRLSVGWMGVNLARIFKEYVDFDGGTFSIDLTCQYVEFSLLFEGEITEDLIRSILKD